MELFKSLDDRAGLADTLNDFGVLEEGRGRNTEALARYREALQIRRGVGDRRGEAESLNNVGYAYHLLGESDNASAYWNQALAVHRETGNREGVILVTQSLGQLQISQGQWDLAVKSFLSALEDSRAMELRFVPLNAEKSPTTITLPSACTATEWIIGSPNANALDRKSVV